MKAVTSQFQACPPMPWNGRYARVMGDTSVFHLRHTGGRLWPVLDWATDAGIGTCRAMECAAARELAAAVAQAKKQLGGSGTGSFSINEFGKVLVPASDGAGKRSMVGRLHGTLLFENPFVPEEPIDLSGDELLENGDPWKRPYVGIPYHLHRNSSIYFYQQNDSGGRTIFPPRQDPGLIQAIRSVRPYGPVRILVNPAGLVLTKVPNGNPSEESWQPTFVGSINPKLWFEEE